MKPSTLLVLALLTATHGLCLANVRTESRGVIFGNESPSDGDLRGETVYVVVGAENSKVEAVYDVSDFSKTAESVLLPLFARADASPQDVLGAARVRASLNGKALTDISIAQPPGASPAVPAELQIVWARIKTGPVFPSRARTGPSLNLRVSYVQPHVDGRFYYFPQSLPVEPSDTLEHSWRFPLIARSPERSMAFSVGESRWEQLGDLLVVYLKADQIVMVEPGAKDAGAPQRSNAPEETSGTAHQSHR